MNILVTGAAGFIGYHAAQRLLGQGHRVVGIDNVNPYYDPALKWARIARLTVHPWFQFIEVDLASVPVMEALFARERFDILLHLAAQAGVRYSIVNPHACTHANVTAFLNVLEGCRNSRIPRLIYASSSSVYGSNPNTPFEVGHPVDAPESLYAATKRSNELMAQCYTHLFGFAATGLRFFTVYGPWGRPDMAPFRFADAIASGSRVDIYNYGRMQRDFTYIDDIAEGLVRVVDRPQSGHRLYNIGNSSPVELMDFIRALERAFGQRSRRRFMPRQAGDVLATHANVEAFCEYTNFRPATSMEEGVNKFVQWYRNYYGHVIRAKVA